jgi:hypothetical protein
MNGVSDRKSYDQRNDIDDHEVQMLYPIILPFDMHLTPLSGILLPAVRILIPAAAQPGCLPHPSLARQRPA